MMEIAEKIKITKPTDNYRCPKCDRELISNNNNLQKSGIVIKSKLVFLDDSGSIFCRCKDCKNIITLPLVFNKYQNSIQNNL